MIGYFERNADTGKTESICFHDIEEQRTLVKVKSVLQLLFKIMNFYIFNGKTFSIDF